VKGVVFVGDYQVDVREWTDPSPGARDVIVEMRASGMCGTDLKLYHGDEDMKKHGLLDRYIGGHEPCGVVVEIGSQVSPAEATVGQRVMVHHYAGCGTCASCRTGWTQMCERGQTRAFGYNANGGHAEFMRVPVNTLVALPDELSFVAGAAISCGTGTAWGALKRLALSGEDQIAIFGQGPVGLSATALASALGIRVIALDVSDERLELAARFGADEMINARTSDDVVAAIADVTGGGVSTSLDATGSSVARRQAVQSLRPWGRSVFVGEGGEVTLNVSEDLLRRQAVLHGSWTFSAVQQEACARFVASRDVRLDDLFSDRWNLADAGEAYRRFDDHTSGKGVFVPV
jgi:threonine dehydrogenase-like Zn-dependent dehydrogenase